MSRGFAFAGVCLAGGCGILIAYSTLRPELARLNAERRGEFVGKYTEADDKVLSRAIMSDLDEARQQLKPKPTKGFAWGIREAIWGKPDDQIAAATTSIRVPTRDEQHMVKSPQELVDKAKAEDAEG